MAYTVLQFTPHTRDGDAMHRATWPMQALGALPDFRVIDLHYLSPYGYQLAFDVDLLILSVVGDAELVPIIRWRKARGKPTVFEINNWPFDIYPLAPVPESWSNPAYSANLLHIASLVDLLQTSTPVLADAFRPYCARVEVFPNQLAQAPESLPARPEKPLVVGWAGSSSHVADVASIARPLSEWVRTHDGVVLAVMGHEQTRKLFTLPADKMRFVAWGDMDAYFEFLKGVHIGVAPLLDIPFNRGRSDVKWLEYAACGCVFVGQRLPTYSTVEDGKTGFLFGNVAELLRMLDKLHQDRALLESVRRAAFEHVTRQRRYHVEIQERAKVYRELLERKPPEAFGAWTLHQRVRFPRPSLPDPMPGYLPMALDAEDERALVELHSRRPNVPEPTIRRIEERYGEFHLTGHARALTALARGDLATAEQHLRQAIEFYPAAIASLQLLGEVLASSRRFDDAKTMLSYAVQWHPACVPVYRDLVAVAEQQSDWPSAIRVTRLWEENCNQDCAARMRRGLLLLRTGEKEGGLDLMADALGRFAERAKHLRLGFVAEVVQILRQADALMEKEARWQDLLLKTAEVFPHGIWLPSRAGAIHFERANYEAGARLLGQARDRLLELEWQRTEGINLVPETRRLIEFQRMACEELARPL